MATNDELDIDKVLDDAANEDDDAKKIELIEKERDDLQTKLAEFEKKEQDKEEEDSEEEEEELDPTMKAMQDKIDAVEAAHVAETLARVDSNMLELAEKYPEIFSKKEVMDKPIIDGAEVTITEYLKLLLEKGDMTSAIKAVETAMKLNDITADNIGNRLPRGRGGGGNHQQDIDTSKKTKHIREMFDAMDTGKYKRMVAKANGAL